MSKWWVMQITYDAYMNASNAGNIEQPAVELFVGSQVILPSE